MDDNNPTTQLHPPIVIDLRKRRGRSKKNRRYSKGLGDLQRMERDVTRISHRMVRSLDKGASAYRKARNKSARNKRDGALRDALPNVGKGMAVTLAEAAPLVEETAKVMNNRLTRRLIREQIKLTSRTLRLVLR